MKILGLDLAISTGWAIAENGSITDSGVVNFKLTAKQTKVIKEEKIREAYGTRSLKFKNFLNEKHAEIGGFDVICFERVMGRQPSLKADWSYIGFAITLLVWCEERDIPCIGVAVNTNKDYATGNGNATKEMMIEAAKEMWFDPENDDEADAIHILNYTMKEIL